MRAASGLLLLCLARVAAAAPSGLTTIPTADVVPVHQLMAQVQNGDTDLRGSESMFHHPEPSFQSQLGLFSSRLECGLDLVTLDSPRQYRPVLNLKALPVQENYTWPAIAVGVQQVGPDFGSVYYLVVSRTLNYEKIQYQKFRAHHRNLKLRGIRMHAGIIGTRDLPRGMVGTDIELSDHFVLDADWISGREHAATLGGAWVISQQSSVQAAFLVSNRESRIDGLQIGLTHQFSW